MKRSIILLLTICSNLSISQINRAYNYIEILTINGKRTPVAITIHEKADTDISFKLEVDYNFFGESPVNCKYSFNKCTVQDSLVFLVKENQDTAAPNPIIIFNKSELFVLAPAEVFECVPSEEIIVLKAFELETIDPKNFQNCDAEVPIPEEIICDFAEEEPDFPGGPEALHDYLSRKINSSSVDRTKNNGIVYVQFVVRENGQITDAIVISGVSPEIDSEALRIINEMPNWKPGKVNGVVCATRFTVPLKFRNY